MSEEPTTAVGWLKELLNPLILHGLAIALVVVIILHRLNAAEILPLPLRQYKPLAFVVLLSLEVVRLAISKDSFVTRARDHRGMIRVLKNLSEVERRWLRTLVKDGNGLIEAHSGIDARLEKYGIIYKASPMLSSIWGESYRWNIEDKARSYLMKHPELIAE